MLACVDVLCRGCPYVTIKVIPEAAAILDETFTLEQL